MKDILFFLKKVVNHLFLKKVVNRLFHKKVGNLHFMGYSNKLLIEIQFNKNIKKFSHQRCFKKLRNKLIFILLVILILGKIINNTFRKIICKQYYKNLNLNNKKECFIKSKLLLEPKIYKIGKF